MKPSTEFLKRHSLVVGIIRMIPLHLDNRLVELGCPANPVTVRCISHGRLGLHLRLAADDRLEARKRSDGVTIYTCILIHRENMS